MATKTIREQSGGAGPELTSGQVWRAVRPGIVRRAQSPYPRRGTLVQRRLVQDQRPEAGHRGRTRQLEGPARGGRRPRRGDCPGAPRRHLVAGGAHSPGDHQLPRDGGRAPGRIAPGPPAAGRAGVPCPRESAGFGVRHRDHPGRGVPHLRDWRLAAFPSSSILRGRSSRSWARPLPYGQRVLGCFEEFYSGRLHLHRGARHPAHLQQPRVRHARPDHRGRDRPAAPPRIFRDRIFGPLGMTSTDLAQVRSRSGPGSRVTGYALRSGGPSPGARPRSGDLSVPSPIYSTTADMARYVAALLAGGSRRARPATQAREFSKACSRLLLTSPIPRLPGVGLAFFRHNLGGHLVAGARRAGARLHLADVAGTLRRHGGCNIALSPTGPEAP